MDALGGSEQHEAFQQETEAEFSHMLTALRTWLFFSFLFFYPNPFMNLILCLNGNITLAEMSQGFIWRVESRVRFLTFLIPKWVKYCRDITAWCQAEMQEGFRYVSSPRGTNGETLWWQSVTGRMRITCVYFTVCVCVFVMRNCWSSCHVKTILTQPLHASISLGSQFMDWPYLTCKAVAEALCRNKKQHFLSSRRKLDIFLFHWGSECWHGQIQTLFYVVCRGYSLVLCLLRIMQELWDWFSRKLL